MWSYLFTGFDICVNLLCYFAARGNRSEIVKMEQRVHALEFERVNAQLRGRVTLLEEDIDKLRRQLGGLTKKVHNNNMHKDDTVMVQGWRIG
jgi:hypothetical protein